VWDIYTEGNPKRAPHTWFRATGGLPQGLRLGSLLHHINAPCPCLLRGPVEPADLRGGIR
jgi:hypothetical protein